MQMRKYVNGQMNETVSLGTGAILTNELVVGQIMNGVVIQVHNNPCNR
jgi:hypothetical protein